MEDAWSLAELVEYGLYAPYIIAKGEHLLRQGMKVGVGGSIALILGGKELLYLGNGDEASHEVEEFLFLHVGTFQLETCHALPDIKEEVEGKVVFLLAYSAKLANLCQTGVDELRVVHKRHVAHTLPSEGAQAVASQHLADFRESYLLFKVIGVNQIDN